MNTSATSTTRIALRGLLCWLAWWLSSTLWAAADSPRQVVLLRSGRVLEAEVLVELDQWTLRFESGAELRVEPDEIDLIADDFRGLYRQMQQRTAREEWGARIKITEFCLRQRLLNEAAQEIQWLSEDGLDRRQIERLTARLDVARRQEATNLAGRVSVETPPIPPQPVPHDGTPSTTHAAIETSRAAESGITPKPEIDLDAFANFVKYVQPHLLMGCSQAQCHGAQAQNGFRLERLERGATPTRSMSEANYVMVRRWLQASEANPLLDQAILAHGGQKEPAWRPQQLGARLIAAWGTVMRSLPNEAEVGPAGPVRQVTFQEALDPNGQPVVEKQPSIPAAHWFKDDPYDPELFNRRRRIAEDVVSDDDDGKLVGEGDGAGQVTSETRVPKALPKTSERGQPIELPPRQPRNDR